MISLGHCGQVGFLCSCVDKWEGKGTRSQRAPFQLQGILGHPALHVTCMVAFMNCSYINAYFLLSFKENLHIIKDWSSIAILRYFVRVGSVVIESWKVDEVTLVRNIFVG